MKNEVQDLYLDDLKSSFGAVTATHLSEGFDGAISPDFVPRMLAQPAQTSKELWLRVKPLVRAIESDDGVLIIDNRITEKPSTNESPLICWHDDHSKDRTIKGLNFISALYHSKEVSLPIGVHRVIKPDYQTDPKTGQRQPKALFTKNHYCRSLLAQAVPNRLCFR